MDFERYRVPASVRDGVWLELPGTSDARFLVSLPGEHNRAYQAALQRAMPMTVDVEGKVQFPELDVVEWQGHRVEAFLEHCVRELPEGMTRELLRTDYYPGLVALFMRASDLAADEAAQASADAKKLRA